MPNPFDQFDAAPPSGFTPMSGPKVDKPAKVNSTVDYIIHPDGSATPRPGGPKDPKAKDDAFGDYSKTGEDFLATVPAQYRNTIKMYAANKLTPPARPSDTMQKILDATAQYDTTYDPALAPNRKKAIQDFTGHGADAQVVGSVNRLASHIHDMFQASEKMGGPNTGIRPLNKMIAGIQQQGEPALVATYDAAKPFVAAELDKIAKGSGNTTTVQGIQDAMASLDRARSLDERRAAFKQLAGIVHGALEPIKQRWDSAYGGTKAPPMWISPKAANVFGALDPENAGTYGGDAWRGLPGLKGDGTPGQGTGPGGGQPPAPTANGPPPTLAPGGPAQTIATGATRNQYDPVLSGKMDRAIRSGLPYDEAAKIVPAGEYGQLDPAQYAASVAYAKANPGYKKSLAEITKPMANSALNRFTASPLATFAMQAANGTSGGFLDEIGGGVATLINGGSLSDNIARANENKQAQAALNPGSALVGNVIGGVGAMVGGGAALKAAGVGKGFLAWAAAHPKLAATAGDALYGGIYGYGENNDNRLVGAGIGALAGAGGSVAGQVGANVIGRGIRGVVNPAVDRLRAAGIPLTFGEVAGGATKRFSDATTGLIGNPLAARYGEGRTALSHALFNETGQIVGKPVDNIGAQGVADLVGIKNQAYAGALDPVSLQVGNPGSIARYADQAAASIPNVDQAPDIVKGAINNYVGGAVDPAGVMSGGDFQQAYRGLSRTASGASPRIFGHEIGSALGKAKDDLASMLETQNPGAYDAFLKANSTNRHLSVLAQAVEAAKNQIDPGGIALPTPAQYMTAASQNATKYGSKIESAMGNKPFFHEQPGGPPTSLISDAQQVMSNKVPSSGTSERLQAMLALGALGTGLGGAGYATDGAEGAGLGTVTALTATTLLNSKVGQKALLAMILRGQNFRKAGQAVINNGAAGGALGAAPAVYLGGQ